MPAPLPQTAARQQPRPRQEMFYSSDSPSYFFLDWAALTAFVAVMAFSIIR